MNTPHVADRSRRDTVAGARTLRVRRDEIRRLAPTPFVAALVILLAIPAMALAQPAPPRVLPPGASIAAHGLTNPRGFTWDADGKLYVALAGVGGAIMATEPAPIVDALGPFFVGPTAAVVAVLDGCPVPVVAGLPSAANALAGAYGVADIAILHDRLYALFVGGGAVRASPDVPSGVYAIEDDGTLALVADLSAWTRANPTEALPWDYDPETGGFDMAAGDDRLWISQPNRDEILTVTPDGLVTRIADLSRGHPVLTGIGLAPDGGVYVGTLTALPFPDGAAKVLHVAEDGTVTDAWTGLTAVTGIAVGPDGILYAAEMATENLEQPPFFQPGTGKVVRQTGPASAEEVATGLTFPISLAFGPDGNLYVGLPAIGANAGEGVVLRLATAAAPAGTPPAPSASPAAGPLGSCVPPANGTPSP
jgi:hypothetical protein